MKIAHTADWHLGKIVSGFLMLEDQKYILNELIKSLKDNHIEVLIISGDIYDRSIPPQEAVKLLDDVIYEIISNLKIEIFIIPGNHDSAQRLSFASKLYNDNGLHIIGSFYKEIPKIILTDKHGPVNFYLLPYFIPNQISKMFEDDENIQIKTFNDAFKTIIDYNKPFIDTSLRNILITHGFFGYLNEENNIFYDQITSPSELSIGGADIIDISPASFFDYIALGHLHSPQKVKNPLFRYSGSLLKYSVDESNQNKSVTLIDIKEKNNIDLNFIHLTPIRDLRIVTGYMRDLCESFESTSLISDDYVFVELLDKDAVFDVIPRLRQTFKNIIGVKMINQFSNDNNIIINKNKPENKDFSTLFYEFYTSVSGQDLDEEKKEIIANILSNLDH